MKLIQITTGILLLFMFSPVWGSARPVLFVSEPVHKFDSIPEGSRLVHTFIITNKGNVPLKILDVRPP